MEALNWYAARLRRMPPVELPYRVGQALRKKTDALRHSWPEPKRGLASSPVLVPSDATGLARSVPGAVDAVQREAEALLAHRFEVFGERHPYGPEIDWHRDPVSGGRWPLGFWANIDYRNRRDLGGVKFVWEVNRLHHLPRLAIAYALTGDARCRQEIFDQVSSWMQANPYPQGVNWSSGIELGIRLVNLTYALKFLEGAIDGGEIALVNRFVHRHAFHLMRYPSRHSSCANHAVAEALGLFVAGLCYPGLPGASRWRRRGVAILEREVARQIQADGSSFEHSVPYLQFVADHFLVYYLLCREHRHPCSDRVAQRLTAVSDFLGALMDESGNVPAIGDDDDGFLLKLWFGRHNNYRSLINSINRLVRGIGSASPVDHKTSLLAGSVPDVPRIRSHRRQCARRFQQAGVVAVRTGRPELLFIGNAGPLGLAPMFGHGHADALSFWLSVGGQPIFVDPGTYLYQNGEPWRSYFRSSRAHNTLTVDGLGQAIPTADFMFERGYGITENRLHHEDDGIAWSAAHDGYGRLADPVVHRRTVWVSQRHPRLRITDELKCAGAHHVACRFHLHPQCRAEADRGRVRIECGEIAATLTVDPGWQNLECVKARNEPRDGWFSTAFGRVEPAVTVVMEARLEGSCRFETEITIDHMEVTDGEEDGEERPDLHRRRVVHL